MKRLKIHIAISMVLGTMIFMGCQEKKDYPPLILGTSTAPTATLSHVADSLNETYTYIVISSSMDGRVFYVTLPSGTETPAATDIILGNTDPAATSINVVAQTDYEIQLKNLTSGGSYDVYAVSTNDVEGKLGDVTGPVSFTCKDFTPPYVDDMVPSNGETWVSHTVSEIVLIMNENVTLLDAGKISVVDAYDESDLGVMGDVSVNGSEVTISITNTIPYVTDVAVLIEAGAFQDAVGLLSDEYYSDGATYDLMFSVEDFVNIENFYGAYQCHETDNTSGAEYTYDVMFFSSSPHTVDIINVYEFGIWGTLVFEEDSCYFPDQPSGLAVGGGTVPLNLITSLYYGYAAFEPGSYTGDGITVKVNCWLYDPAIPSDVYLFSDFEFTKYLTPGVKALPQPNQEKLQQILKSRGKSFK